VTRIYRDEVSRMIHTLIAAGVTAILMTACGNGRPAAVPHGPTALSPPGSSITYPSLCKAYFGTPAAVAKEFGMPSLRSSFSGLGPGRVCSTFQCGYLGSGPTGRRNGVTLTLSTHELSTRDVSFSVYVGKAGVVYAYAAPDPFSTLVHVPQNIQVWLQKAAARAIPPK
jgi:hypothetical protein